MIFMHMSPDGTVVVFRSMRTGPGDLYRKLVGRADAEELLLRSDQLKVPNRLVGGRPLPDVYQHQPARRTPTFGCCRCREIRRRRCFCRLRSARSTVSSRPTASGWPTNRMSRVGLRSTCGRFVPPGDERRRGGWGPVADIHGRRHLSRYGDLTAKSCTTSTPRAR